MPLFSLSLILFRSFKVCFSSLYFVLLSSIPWYGSLKVALFKHLLIEGHSGCFQFGAVTNKADMSICVQVLPKHNPPFFFFWDKSSTLQIAESYGKHIFSFVRNSICFSRVAAPFFIAISNICVLAYLPAFAVTFLFQLPNWFLVLSHCGFNLHLFNAQQL